MDIQGNTKFGQGYWVDRFKPGATTVISGGGSGSNQRNSFAESADGIRTAFTLPSAPSDGNLQVFANGVLQSEPSDYSLSGTIVIFTTTPAVGTTLLAYYGGGSQRQTVSGTIDGVNKVFTLPSSPISVGLQFFWNGLLQHETDDYSLVGNQITMVIAPSPGDNLVAYF